MRLRLYITFLFYSLLFSGCSLYSDFPFEYYENTEPTRKLEFNMTDGTIINVNASDMAMVKKSKDFYTIYYKNGKSLTLRKDQVASVKMIDQRKVDALNAGLVITGLAVGIAFVAILIYAFASML